MAVKLFCPVGFLSIVFTILMNCLTLLGENFHGSPGQHIVCGKDHHGSRTTQVSENSQIVRSIGKQNFLKLRCILKEIECFLNSALVTNCL